MAVEAPIAPPTVTPSAPAPPPAPTKSIQVSAIPAPVEPPAPPAPGSAKDRLFTDLRKKAKPTNTPETPKETPKAEPKVEAPKVEPPKVEAKEPTIAPEAKEGVTPEPGKEKVSPWKLVDQYKAKTAELEKQIAEAKNIPEAERKSLSEKLEKFESRNKELEDEIRFVNYEKSTEFREQYQVPFEKAWSEALEELAEIPITDATNGSLRAADHNDLMKLVNLPLDKAREMANELFGDFADDAMAHRKEIQKLFKTRTKALEEARKLGADREQKQMAERNKVLSELSGTVKDYWEKSNEAVLGDEKYGPYMRPIEGDMEGNQKLSKGYEMVDRAFKENPMDPNLSAEQRREIVKRHAAVRHRAAAFGRLRQWLEVARQENAELKKELDLYKSSEPSTGTVPGSQKPGLDTPMSPSARLFTALRHIAK